ncbi:MAG: methyltransferase domain-containing protein [Campylobacterota bacterium]|nr:methyltransferase domain-containing protein [Campylobacterota bacterium]
MISHNDLVNHLINSKALHSTNIIEAFRNIDRVDFVYDSSVEGVYGDYPLQIGYNQTISQPSTVAMMFEMLEPYLGQKILDIGSGSGWTTALLGFIVGDKGSVIGLERVNELVEFGSENISKYRFKNAKIIKAKDELGIPNEKFDRILVSAASEQLPHNLLKQLKTGGKLVIPIKNSIYEIIKKGDEEFETTEHYGFRFVPLIY